MKNNKKEEELDPETAMELAGTIKATATKLFGSGNILGDLAAKLDEASDSVFRALRKQRERALQKKELERAKQDKKKAAPPRIAAIAAPAHHNELPGVEIGDLANLGGANL